MVSLKSTEIFALDRHSAAHAEGLWRYTEDGWGLEALPLVHIDHAEDAIYQRLIKTHGDKLLRPLTLLDILIKYLVQYAIIGQRVGVLLSGAELGAGGFGDDVFWDYLTIAVDIVSQFINLGLINIAKNSETTAHVAIKGAIAHCGFAFIGSVEQDIAELIAHGHEEGTAHTCLEVFFGDIERQFFEKRL